MVDRIILAITGASGSGYAISLLKMLCRQGVVVDGLLSNAGRQVMHLETGLGPDDLSDYVGRWYPVDDFTAPMASGSSRYRAMVVLPCTMGSLAAIANGLSANLIHRAADVMLKERRPLILAPRETPLNRNHLQNLLKAHEAGAVICPPMPAFYHRPADLEQMVDDFAGRVARLLGYDIPGLQSWSGLPGEPDDSGRQA